MRYGFVIDQDRCIGCHACTVACKEEHQVPIGVFRTWVKYVEKGEFPHTSRHFGVMRCNHCDSAPCIEICPTHALYRRSDGIVDFDNTRCIGCKSCMQACPYDALYIDPNSNTAAKCNFCAHRVENKLEPACVIVCPTQAIIAGDLDDSTSYASRLVATQKVSVRKPHKGTEPKLYYIGIEGDLLEPSRMERQSTYAFAEQRDQHLAQQVFDPAVTREVYDVAHPAPWGWKIAAYLWTKSIAAGVLMVAGLLVGIRPDLRITVLDFVSPVIALVALAVTMALLVFDLKRPDRFFYLLTKPNFRSWLVLGSYILMAYGAVAVLWLLSAAKLLYVFPLLAWSAVLLGMASAGYSAFLFAQAKGRDLWQSTLFLWHLLVQASVAGAAVLVIATGMFDFGEWRQFSVSIASLHILVLSLMLNLAMVTFEVFRPHATADSQRAVATMTRGRLSFRFWGLAVGLGMVVPLLLFMGIVSDQSPPLAEVLVAVLALLGLWFYEDIWVKAGQSVPLS
jgi:Fe-S-cluster-containing dehydrogenase component/formate-dependent nitrite reductase membrane component NrfD